MLRLCPFELLFPKDVAEATALLSLYGETAKICAGGTDLLPNMKHELHEPQFVVHLGAVSELRGMSEGVMPAKAGIQELVIGAMTTLDEVANSPLVKAYAPSLAAAACHVAGPQLRNMGTIGGNLCLDTRCLYYNQSYFWREAVGFCLKKCGDACHVTKTGKRCVAASSNDTATALLCLDARLELISERGMRMVPIEEFYVANGEKNNILAADEILSRVIISKPPLHRREGFSKLRHREAVDFPMLSVAVRFDLDDSDFIQDARLTVNALAAKPKQLDVRWMLGRKLDERLVLEAGEFAKVRCIPLTNICDDPKWRKDMVAVYVKKACSFIFN